MPPSVPSSRKKLPSNLAAAPATPRNLCEKNLRALPKTRDRRSKNLVTPETTSQTLARKTRNRNHNRGLNNHRAKTRKSEDEVSSASSSGTKKRGRSKSRQPPPFNPEETQSYVQEDESIFLHQVEIPFHLEEDEAKKTRRRTCQQSRRVQQRRAQQGQKRELARETKRCNYYFSQFTSSLKIQRLYISQFGFCADHTKPVWQNVQDYIKNLPAHYLFVYHSQVKGCHNLLHPDTSFPRAIPSILHLGRKFIPHLPTTTNYFRESADHFKQDVRRISTFYDKPPQDDGSYILQLYFKSDWIPNPCKDLGVERAMKKFLTSIRQEQQHRYSRPILSNIFPHHWRLIRRLRNHDDYIVVEADKNLGGCILNRSTYISRTFQDHLGNSEVY